MLTCCARMSKLQSKRLMTMTACSSNHLPQQHGATRRPRKKESENGLHAGPRRRGFEAGLRLTFSLSLPIMMSSSTGSREGGVPSQDSISALISGVLCANGAKHSRLGLRGQGAGGRSNVAHRAARTEPNDQDQWQLLRLVNRQVDRIKSLTCR